MDNILDWEVYAAVAHFSEAILHPEKWYSLSFTSFSVFIILLLFLCKVSCVR